MCKLTCIENREECFSQSVIPLSVFFCFLRIFFIHSLFNILINNSFTVRVCLFFSVVQPQGYLCRMQEPSVAQKSFLFS
jgi:hypothetical protein